MTPGFPTQTSCIARCVSANDLALWVALWDPVGMSLEPHLPKSLDGSSKLFEVQETAQKDAKRIFVRRYGIVQSTGCTLITGTIYKLGV